MTTETLCLNVKTVLGTGDPFDVIMLIPLISQFGAPRECLAGLTGTPCDKPLRRLYILAEPLQGFGGPPEGFHALGACEHHHQQLVNGERLGPEDTAEDEDGNEA